MNKLLVKKLLNLALDPAAYVGEVENAATKLAHHLRSEGVKSFDDLVGELGPPPSPPPPRQRTSDSWRPAPEKTNMPFGKYKGTSLGEIYQKDRAYLYWVIERCENLRPWLKTEICKVLGVTPP